MGMKEVFQNEQYCYEELGRIRGVWGNKDKFTSNAIEAIRTTLAWMYAYCPDTVRSIVESHMFELDIRASYAAMRSPAHE